MRSPFKFLDSFEYKDRDVFFGRDKEIKNLYRMVYRNPLTLVYGLSGTGKTSLVKCGLASKFDGPDWFPISIRRGSNLNIAFQEEMNKKIGNDQLSIPDAINQINRQYLRPIYLIFDQFEELFILGDKAEQKQFVQTIQQLLEQELPCRILLIMREEYLGNMYEFEKEIPHIFDNRLRVERMNNDKVKEVLTNSFSRFNIKLKAPQDERLEQMLNNISNKKSLVQLPYLQVYLDMLYHEDHIRTIGSPRTDDNSFPKLEFTEEEIRDFGKIDNVLNKYLEEQYLVIPQKLGWKQDNAADEVKNILDIFVSPEGTKTPIAFTRLDTNKEINIGESYQKQLAPTSSTAIANVLEAAINARILRATDNNYLELAHDSLAAAIDSKRTAEDRELRQMEREIKIRYAVYQDSKNSSDYISASRLELYRSKLEKLRLSDKEHQFFKESEIFQEKEISRKEQELIKERELRTQAEKSQQEALKNEKTAQKRTKQAWMISALALVAFVIAILLGFDARKKEKKAKKAQATADKNLQAFKEEQTLNIAKELQAAALRFQALEQSTLAKKTFEEARDSIITIDTYKNNATYLEIIESLDNYEK